jgi:hypothetical protein
MRNAEDIFHIRNSVAATVLASITSECSLIHPSTQEEFWLRAFFTPKIINHHDPCCERESKK